MTVAVWNLTAADGELRIRTGVTGRAARMGHRLSIAMTDWHAAVQWTAGEPSVAELTVDVASLEIVRGEGGVMSLSGPEKALARSHALKSLEAQRYPEIRFQADDIVKTPDGYRLTGTVAIHGQRRDQVIELHVDDLGDSWRMSCETVVRRSDFAVKQYSMLMGAVKVADEVTVSFTARMTKD
jgi:polyisoprenoid-binding protein YceI